MTIELNSLITEALDDLKGQNTVAMNVSDISNFMDTMIVATGTSSRHVKSLAQNVIDAGKKLDLRPIGVEGMESGDWVLVDYGDVVVHVMLSQTRLFYDLEKLWTPLNEGDASNAKIESDKNSDG